MGLFNGRETIECGDGNSSAQDKIQYAYHTGVHHTHCFLLLAIVSPDIPVTDLGTARPNLSSLSSSYSRDVPTVHSTQIVVWELKGSSLSLQFFCRQNPNADIHLPPTSVRIPFSSLLQPSFLQLVRAPFQLVACRN